MHHSCSNDPILPRDVAIDNEVSYANVVTTKKDTTKLPKRFYATPLGDRTGIMKCRVLDLLGQGSPRSNTNTNEEESLQSRASEHQSRRSKISEERERISRSRAAELSVNYELSDTKNTELNRNAVLTMSLNSFVPSLGTPMSSMKQASGIVSQDNDSKVGHLPKTLDSFSDDFQGRSRKGSFDRARQIRKNFMFPKKNASMLNVSVDPTIVSDKSQDESENRNPDHILHDATRDAANKTTVFPTLKTSHPNIIQDLPDLC